MARSNFVLMLGLRLRYALYGLIVVAVFAMIGSFYTQEAELIHIPVFGIVTESAGRLAGYIIGGLVAYYLIVTAVDETMQFYSYNKVGSGRVARMFFKHRDVVHFESSPEAKWRSAKKYSFYLHVVPMTLFWLGVLLGILEFMAKGMGFLVVFYPLGLYLLAGLSMSYAKQHLCDSEIDEMYERPQTYIDMVTQAKQEVAERAATERAKELIKRERARNLPKPPKSDDQMNTPDKPY